MGAGSTCARTLRQSLRGGGDAIDIAPQGAGASAIRRW